MLSILVSPRLCSPCAVDIRRTILQPAACVVGKGSLTVEADDPVGHEEHEEDDDDPAEDLGHPSPVVDLVAGILLVLDAGHDGGEDGEEEEVAEAHPEHGVGLEPLAVRRLVEVVDPCEETSAGQIERNRNRGEEGG